MNTSLRMHAYLRCYLLAVLLIPFAATAQWSLLDLETDEQLWSVHYRADGNVWIGAGDTIHYSLDHGTTFDKRGTVNQLNQPLFGAYVALHAFSPSTAVITGVLNTGVAESIYRTPNAGTSYELVFYQNVGLLDRLNDVEFAQAPVGIAVGANGSIRRTTDQGLTWTAVPSPTTDYLYSVVHVSGNTYLCASSYGHYRSTDQGLTWSALPGSPQAERLSVHAGVVYAAGGAQVLRSLDNGSTWTPMGAVPGTVRSLVALNGTTLIAAANQGVYRSTTSGQYWEQFVLPGAPVIEQISFYDAQHGIAVGADGYAIHTGNGGGNTVPLAALTASGGTLCQNTPITFTSPNDPSYTFTWIVNGAVIANTGPVLTTSFGTAGTQQVQVVVDNGFATDTAEVTVNVWSAPAVPPYTVTANPDSICPGSNTTITVPGTVPGISYRLVRDGVPVGPIEYGNGGPKSFTATNVALGTTFSVRGIDTNGCGADTVYTPAWLVVFNGSPGTTFSLTLDSICYPGTSAVLVQNAHPGFRYRYTSPTMSAGPFLLSSGGMVTLPILNIPGTAYPFHAVQVETKYDNTGCSFVLPGVDTLHVFSQVLVHDLPDTLMLTGGSFDPSASAPSFNLFQWQFGSGATPNSFVGADPPLVTWSQPGIYTATITASIGSVCQASDTAKVEVVDPVPMNQLPICGNGSVDGDLYVSDLYLDGYNNRYLTGQYHGGVVDTQRDFFVMKVDSLGELVWKYKAPTGTFPNTFGLAITADQQGNAYVTIQSGTFNNQAVNGVFPGHAYWLMKFDRTGAAEWVMSSPTMRFRGVACTPDNTIHVAGHGTWNGAYIELPNGEPIQLPAASADPGAGGMALIQLAPDGTLLGWNSFGRATHPDSLTAFPVDFTAGTDLPSVRYRIDPTLEALPNGDLLISGVMASRRDPWQVDLDGTAMVNHAGTDTTLNLHQIYGARYTPGSGFTSAFAAVGGDVDRLQRMFLAADGSYRICGWMRNAFIANGTLTDLGYPGGGLYGPYNGFLAKLDQNGSVVWKAYADGFHPFDLNVDDLGNTQVLATANVFGRIPDASGQVVGLVDQGGPDRVMVSYSPAGAVQGADVLAMSGTEVGYRMRPDACGNAHVVTVTGLSGAFTRSDAMTCIGCVDNVRFDVVGSGGCGGNCAAAFDPAFRDVALLDLRLSSDSTGNDGPRDVVVDVQSMGGVPAGSMELAYRINGGAVQTQPWSGTLAYGDRLNDLVIGSSPFTNAPYFMVEAWINTENGSPDMDAANDTLRLEQLICNTPLSGTYTLGPGGVFPSFAAAEAALMTCGIAATTVFEVLDGDYYDQLSIGAIAGVSVTDSVVFRSVAQDSAAVSFHLFRRRPNRFEPILIGSDASMITFEDLSIFNSNPTAINLAVIGLGNCDRVNILGCLLQGLPGNLGMVLAPNNDVQTRLRIERNTLRFMGTGVEGATNQSLAYDSLITIKDNFFDRQRGVGFRWINKVHAVEVDHNRFFGEPPYTASDYTAIQVGEGDTGPTRVTRNAVHHINNGSAGSRLMVVRAGVLFPGRTLVANNMVSAENTTGFIALEYPAAGGPADIVHNTFNGSIRLYGSSVNDVVVRNNIINASGEVIRVNVWGPTTGLVMDRNLYWSTDTALGWAWLHTSTDQYTLGDWQAQFGWDQNSELWEAQFVSSSDLHLGAGNWFSCPTLPNIPMDIDGDLRGPVITCQGADEGSFSVAVPSEVLPGTLELWPNPSAGEGWIALPDGSGGTLRILDARGSVVHERFIPNGGSQVAIPAPAAPGVYLVRWCTDQGHAFTERWVVLGRNGE